MEGGRRIGKNEGKEGCETYRITSVNKVHYLRFKKLHKSREFLLSEKNKGNGEREKEREREREGIE